MSFWIVEMGNRIGIYQVKKEVARMSNLFLSEIDARYFSRE
jgi:hypothetical protein